MLYLNMGVVCHFDSDMSAGDGGFDKVAQCKPLFLCVWERGMALAIYVFMALLRSLQFVFSASKWKGILVCLVGNSSNLFSPSLLFIGRNLHLSYC